VFGNVTRTTETRRVRDLSWDLRFEAITEKAPSGIEPLYEALQASA
jgi:hypothetical protein